MPTSRKRAGWTTANADTLRVLSHRPPVWAALLSDCVADAHRWHICTGRHWAHLCHICTGRHWAHLCHICTGRHWAHLCHICTGTCSFLPQLTHACHVCRVALCCVRHTGTAGSVARRTVRPHGRNEQGEGTRAQALVASLHEANGQRRKGASPSPRHARTHARVRTLLHTCTQHPPARARRLTPRQCVALALRRVPLRFDTGR